MDFDKKKCYPIYTCIFILKQDTAVSFFTTSNFNLLLSEHKTISPSKPYYILCFQPSADPSGLPQQIGNKTECAMLGFVIDLGVDYRQVSGFNILKK